MPNENEVLESKIAEMNNSDQPAPVEETNTEDPKQEGEPVEKTEEPSEPTIDYKSKLEEAQARLKRAEDKIVKLKKQPSSEEDTKEEPDEDRVAQLVKQQVDSLRDQVRGEIVESEVEDLLTEISGNADERALIKHIYEHNLQKAGFTRAAIRENLLNAKVLANRDALIKSNKELSEALVSKATTATTRSVSSSSRPSVSDEPKMSEKDRKILARIEANKMNR